MATTGDIGVGTVLRYNGELVQIVEYMHRTPGNLRAFYHFPAHWDPKLRIPRGQVVAAASIVSPKY